MITYWSIVNERNFYSWDLPKGCQVILTGNPVDEGDYFTSQLDMAQKSRFFEFGFKFDIDSWASYAVREKIDSRCINFLLGYHNEVLFDQGSEDAEPKMITNPRQWTKFFNAIKYIKDFNKPDSLELIQTIGSGIVPEGINQFTTFINQQLDKLPTAEWVMNHNDDKQVMRELKTIIGDVESSKQSFKPEVASIISTRIVLYLLNEFTDKPITEEIVDRLELLFKDKAFSSDLEYRISRELMSNSSKRFNKVRKAFISKLMRRKTFKRVFSSTS